MNYFRSLLFLDFFLHWNKSYEFYICFYEQVFVLTISFHIFIIIIVQDQFSYHLPNGWFFSDSYSIGKYYEDDVKHDGVQDW